MILVNHRDVATPFAHDHEREALNGGPSMITVNKGGAIASDIDRRSWKSGACG